MNITFNFPLMPGNYVSNCGLKKSQSFKKRPLFGVCRIKIEHFPKIEKLCNNIFPIADSETCKTPAYIVTRFIRGEPERRRKITARIGIVFHHEMNRRPMRKFHRPRFAQRNAPIHIGQCLLVSPRQVVSERSQDKC